MGKIGRRNRLGEKKETIKTWFTSLDTSTVRWAWSMKSRIFLSGIPFSKLDPDQRQNVVNMLPQFAPQVIVFSKDDLHDVFSPDSIGRVWTIQSNEEKNIARIEEGKLWK